MLPTKPPGMCGDVNWPVPEMCPHFTCFTGTNVQILTGRFLRCAPHFTCLTRPHFPCCTGTKVQILTGLWLRMCLRRARGWRSHALYSLYWYKSTNTDRPVAQSVPEASTWLALARKALPGCLTGTKVQILLSDWYKSTNTAV
jgi:hypothetical protein